MGHDRPVFQTGTVMAPLEPRSKEEETMELGPLKGEGAIPMAHEEQLGDEDEAVLGPSGFRRIAREGAG